MDNISFSEGAMAYPSDFSVAMNKERVTVVASPKVFKERLCLNAQIEVVNALTFDIEAAYQMYAHKELYDVKIYLAFIKTLLKSIK